MTKLNKGFIYAILSAFSFSFTGIVIKHAYQTGLSPLETLALQSWLASLVLLVGLKVLAPQYLRNTNKKLPQLFILGALGSLGTSLLYANSLKLLDASVTTLLLYTYPAWVALGVHLFFGRKLSRTEIATLLVTCIGILLTANVTSINNFSLGLFLGLGSGITYAFFNLYGEAMLRDVNPWTVTAYTQFASSIALLLIKPPLFVLTGTITMNQWLLGLTLATLCSILPFYLLMLAISHIKSDKASIISTLEIPITLFFAHLLLDEILSFSQLSGALLIALSVLALRIFERRRAGKLVNTAEVLARD